MNRSPQLPISGFAGYVNPLPMANKTIGPNFMGTVFFRLSVWTLSAMILLRAGDSVVAQDVCIELDFASLPSAQGWTYETLSTVPESDVFSVDGTTLQLNSIGQGINPPNTTANFMYSIYDTVDSTRPFSIEATARVLDVEARPSFGITAFLGNDGVIVNISEDTLYVDDRSTGNPGIPVFTLDATQFHDYRFYIRPTDEAFDIYVDDVWVAEGLFHSDLPIDEHIRFGDVTSFGNTTAEVSRFKIYQVPEPSSLALLGIMAVLSTLFRSSRVKGT